MESSAMNELTVSFLALERVSTNVPIKFPTRFLADSQLHVSPLVFGCVSCFHFPNHSPQPLLCQLWLYTQWYKKNGLLSFMILFINLLWMDHSTIWLSTFHMPNHLNKVKQFQGQEFKTYKIWHFFRNFHIPYMTQSSMQVYRMSRP